MGTVIHECGQLLVVTTLKSGKIYYDSGGNGIKHCPKCGKELNYAK